MSVKLEALLVAEILQNPKNARGSGSRLGILSHFHEDGRFSSAVENSP